MSEAVLSTSYTTKPGSYQTTANKPAHKPLKSISLFSGAGGMDVGFSRAGFEVIWANEIRPDAAKTYEFNHQGTMRCGDIRDLLDEVSTLQGVDAVFGGPPCQGFSVAGKMDPTDERSQLVFTFFDVVERTNPKMFVLENVKALAKLEKWHNIRSKMFERAWKLGFDYVDLIVLNATHYNVPQKRERMFLIGIKGATGLSDKGGIQHYLGKYQKLSEPVGDLFRQLGPAGSPGNSSICNAKITIATDPIMRASAYAGMMFNGAGRPINAKEYSNTLPATMGGNKTPIIDEEEVFNGAGSWIERYHQRLLTGERPKDIAVPKHLRRITVEEAAMIQSFPPNYKWAGKQSAIYCQIGEAVPCNLAYAVASAIRDALEDARI